ncbi:MAG: hypothetical protein OEM96_05720 [Gemmatimonadota bacterium]|nr:hypothetical protein [Gemmatimonadota bacterium]
MLRTTIRLTRVFLVLVSLTGCGSDPAAPGTDPFPDSGQVIKVLVLNSTGQTLAGFAVGESISADGAAIDLGAGFDGVTVDASRTRAVSTVSSFGGSRLLFADLASGAVQATAFPAPEGIDANPSRPTFDSTGTTVFVAGRGSNAIYAASPGDAEASRIATAVGAFVERVIPIDDALFALDANLDDDGGTFAPLGPGRIFVIEAGAIAGTIDLPAAAQNPIDMVRIGSRLVVLLGGTFDPITFSPNGDGGIVTVDVQTRAASGFVALGGNGVAIEAGADGLAYVTSTTDFISLDAQVVDPALPAGGLRELSVRDQFGARVDCWALTGLADGRRLCVTFRFASPGRLLLLANEGDAIAELPSGFGSTDVQLQ